MSVVEKSAPQRTIVGLVVGVVAVLVLAIVVAVSVGDGSSSTADQQGSSSTADRSGPSSTTRPVTTVVPTMVIVKGASPVTVP